MPSQAGPEPSRESTALDDSGTAQLFLFLGWMPPAITALVGGLIAGFMTGRLEALVVAVIGGTLVGYIACLMLLFTVGSYLERRAIGGWAAKAFIVLNIAASVLAAIGIAVLASIAIPLALQVTAAVIGFGIVAIVALFVAVARSSP